MRTTILLASLVLAGCAGHAAAPGATSPGKAATAPLHAPGSVALENLRFLAGTWRGERNGRWIEEIWSEPVGNSLVGIARVLDGPDPVDQEAAIVLQSEDMLVLHLRHYGAVADRLEERGPAVAWRLVAHGPTEATFEPMGPERIRRITYRAPEPDRLEVVLEPAAGEPLQWRYERAR